MRLARGSLVLTFPILSWEVGEGLAFSICHLLFITFALLLTCLLPLITLWGVKFTLTTLTLERYYWHPRSLKPFLSVQISDPSRHQVYSQARSMCPQFYRDAKLWGGASQLQLIYRSTLQYFQLTIPHSQRDTCPLLKFFNCRPSINLWGWNPASKTNAILGNRLWACDICGPIHWDEDKKLIPYITLFSNLWDSIGPSDSLELLLWITPIYLKPCAQDTREQDWFIKSFEESIRWPCWIMRPISRINLWNFVTSSIGQT